MNLSVMKLQDGTDQQAPFENLAHDREELERNRDKPDGDET